MNDNKEEIRMCEINPRRHLGIEIQMENLAEFFFKCKTETGFLFIFD